LLVGSLVKVGNLGLDKECLLLVDDDDVLDALVNDLTGLQEEAGIASPDELAAVVGLAT
jgi:hypothetical protein